MKEERYIDIMKRDISSFDTSNSLNLPIQIEYLTFFGFLNRQLIPFNILENEIIVYATIDLDGTLIHKIPNNLHIKGSLKLNNSNVEKLPNKLFIEERLFLQNSRIEEIPNDIFVEKSIYMDSNLLKNIPDDLGVKRLHVFFEEEFQPF